MQSFPAEFRVLIIGSSGGIGSAFIQVVQQHPHCGVVIGLHRKSEPDIDFDQESSVGQAAYAVAPQGPFHLIINAAGVLHGPGFMPEKKLADLNYAQLEATFRANTLGPALVLRHFSPLLDHQRGVMAFISAKVGSIGDNRLGGWYAYRASKAALNMLIKTAAIEIKRSNPQAVVLALHPGTVRSALSKPFGGGANARAGEDAAHDMLQVIDKALPEHSGSFLAYDGAVLPW
jgi:NAD(P)-dependent dehydrogenase (short-subunit alcohol dehydrogenase family)